jgi:cysteine desulfurase
MSSSSPNSAEHPPAAYLDHAATTPMLPSVIAAVNEQFALTGNASSLHAAGRRARRTVEEARERVADALGARPSEVVFTAGGTESDNLAVKGLFWARRADDARRVRILASAVEHHAVLDAVQWLGAFTGAEVDWLPVDRLGRVDPAQVRDRIVNGRGGPAAVAAITCMWANNEVGTVQPVPALAALAHDFGIPFHTDAVQAVGAVPVDFADGPSAPDALSFSGHKLGGPVGAGALLLRRETSLVPLQHGGGQEREVRSGTLDVAAIAGLAVAVEEAVHGRVERAARIRRLRDDLIQGVLSIAPDAVVGGDVATEGRLPGNAHIAFPGCEGDALLLLLDAAGVECSTGSACSAGVPEPSHVLMAMGYDDSLARASLRFSLGHSSAPADVERVLGVLPEVLVRARAAGAAARARKAAV